MSACAQLAHEIRTRGPIPTIRVSSAQASGAAKQFPYWGAVRYAIRLTRAGWPANLPLERAGSDRRSCRLAEQDAAAIAAREGRIRLDRIGRLSEDEAERILGDAAAARLRAERRARRPTEARPLPARLLLYLAGKAGLTEVDPDGPISREGRWIVATAADGRQLRGYVPYGDERDAAAFRAESSHMRRRLIHQACGDRVLYAETRVLHQDEGGLLMEVDNGLTCARVVRVQCPFTGAPAEWPCSPWARTVRDAIASTIAWLRSGGQTNGTPAAEAVQRIRQDARRYRWEEVPDDVA